MSHWNDPIDTRIPVEYQLRIRREQQEERHALAMGAAQSAGVHDARGLTESAAQDWQDVEDLVGVPVPAMYRRARKAAERATCESHDGLCQAGCK